MVVSRDQPGYQPEESTTVLCTHYCLGRRCGQDGRVGGWQIAGSRRYQAVRIARSRMRLTLAVLASCPFVPSTCLDLIYLLT